MMALTSSPESTFTVLPTMPEDNWVLKLYLSFPFAPFFVVMMSTPFDALDPYNAVAEASFKILNDSMSLELMKLKALPAPEMALVSSGTPSITIKGSLLALNEEPPRIRMVLPDPGWPPLEMIETPGTLPAIICSGVEIIPF